MATTLRTSYAGNTVFEARSVADAIAVLGQGMAIDLVLLDRTLDDSRGIQTLKRVKAWCDPKGCNPRLVVVSGAADYIDTLVNDCIEECATGFIEKENTEAKFLVAIAKTLRAGMYISDRYGKQPAGSRSPEVDDSGGIVLTGRERQVLPHLVRGLTYKQVARRIREEDGGDIGISEHTVRVHVQRMVRKVMVAQGAIDDLGAKAAVVMAWARDRFKPAS